MITAANRVRVRGLVTLTTILLALIILLAGAGSPAAAAPAAPAYTIDSFATPTVFSTAHNAGCVNQAYPVCDTYQVTARDAGSQPTDGSTITLADTLPAGVTVQSISFYWNGPGATAVGLQAQDLFAFGFCSMTPLQCTMPLAISPDDTLEMLIRVSVDSSGSGQLTNTATISGGGAPSVSTSAQNPVNAGAPAFGVSALSSFAAAADGQPDTQAADHPYELTTRIDLNNEFDTKLGAAKFGSVEDVKNVVVDLPLGFVGSALAAPQCTFAQLSSSGAGGCPPDTQVGLLDTEPAGYASIGLQGAAGAPVYNMVPEHGVAAEFGFVDNLAGAHVLYARVVPGAGGYVLQVTSPDLPQIAMTDVVVTFFGDPAAKDASGNTPLAMFTNPTDCNGQPLATTVHMDSWQNPGRFNADGTPNLSDQNWVSASSSAPPVTGCDQLGFKPAITAQPDTTVADSPSGLHVDIKVPQDENPDTLGTPPLKDATVTLPPGFTVDPSSAAGLGACSPAQIALGSAASPTCPDDSKIGTVALQTPLIPGTLTGSIYLASEFENPFHSLLAGYIVVDDPTTGVVIKIPGNLTPNPVTGQITGDVRQQPAIPVQRSAARFQGRSDRRARNARELRDVHHGFRLFAVVRAGLRAGDDAERFVRDRLRLCGRV